MTVSSTARPECVFTHALGGLNKSGKPGGPSKKTHLNDSMCKLAAKTADDADLGVVLYTARGHGHSTGWEVRPGTPIRDISCCCHPLTGAPAAPEKRGKRRSAEMIRTCMRCSGPRRRWPGP